MTTQQIRNIINSQLDNVLARAKEEIKKEGKKKVEELKQQIPTPEDIMKKLQSEINEDSCSPQGREKFMKKYNSLQQKLKSIQNIVKEALQKIESLENKVKPIFEGEGPIGQISQMAELLKSTLIPALKIIVLAAPLILAAFVGPTASGVGIDQAQQKRDKAKATVVIFTSLIASIVGMIIYYKNMAENLLKKLDPIKSKISMVDEKITELLLFMVSLLLQYEEGCADLENSKNDSVGNSNNAIVPDPNGSTPLQQYMALLNNQYNDVYNKLQQSGNKKALKRVFKVKENLEEDYNISFKIININEDSNKLNRS